ncbi:hypothetical protein QA600_00880 [Natronococcus sp. A-GB1]|nr:hypothetical protein [Natronococcus sp. A-GB1]MDG5757896.1 hypothetical protein [Natronococcus sp. A-GB1]
MTATTLTPRMRKQQAALEAIPPIERSIENGELRLVRQFRGLTLEQAAGYLEALGGERVGENEVEGDGWLVQLSAEKVPVGPSYRLTEVTVVWTGRPDAVEPIVLQFRRKAFRAPG